MSTSFDNVFKAIAEGAISTYLTNSDENKNIGDIVSTFMENFKNNGGNIFMTSKKRSHDSDDEETEKPKKKRRSHKRATGTDACQAKAVNDYGQCTRGHKPGEIFCGTHLRKFGENPESVECVVNCDNEETTTLIPTPVISKKKPKKAPESEGMRLTKKTAKKIAKQTAKTAVVHPDDEDDENDDEIPTAKTTSFKGKKPATTSLVSKINDIFYNGKTYKIDSDFTVYIRESNGQIKEVGSYDVDTNEINFNDDHTKTVASVDEGKEENSEEELEEDYMV